MRKNICLILVFLALLNSSYGQRFYFKTGIGYAVPLAGQISDNYTPYSGTITTDALNVQTAKLHKASFNTGLALDCGVGYSIRQNVGVEVNVVYNIYATKYRFEFRDSYDPNTWDTKQWESFEKQAKGSLFVIPAIVFQTNPAKLTAYMRLGVVLPVITQIINTKTNVTDSRYYPTDSSTEINRLTNRFSLGFAGALGAKRNLNRHLGIWAEFNFVSLSVYAKQNTLVGDEFNGQPTANSGSSGNGITKFSLNAGGSGTNEVWPTYSLPFSNIGFHMGICYALVKKPKPLEVKE